MAKNVADILEAKGHKLNTISPDKSVQDAVTILCDKNIGSLVVVKENHELAGIITERDVLRQCAKHPDKLASVKIGDVMTREVLVGKPADSLHFVEQIMTERHIRHLPIVEGQKVTGMVSIGDVVKALFGDSKQEADDLRDRLAGHYVVS
jgi:CBS domain-containing protein